MGTMNSCIDEYKTIIMYQKSESILPFIYHEMSSLNSLKLNSSMTLQTSTYAPTCMPVPGVSIAQKDGSAMQASWNKYYKKT